MTESHPLPTERFLAMRTTLLPRDTNAHGTIFGGVLLAHIDLAGAVSARKFMADQNWTPHPVVTVAMNKVEFLQPVHVGDLISFWTTITRIGNTSLTVHVETEAARETPVENPVATADVTFVAIDEADGKRKPVPLRS